MIRKGFSLYLVRSAKYGTTLKLTDANHKRLVTLADTSPDVADYAIGTPTLQYYKDGKFKQTTVPVLVVHKNGKQSYWDHSHFQTTGAGPSLSRDVKRAHAIEAGASYELFDYNRFNENIIEMKNRQSAQSLLYAGYGLDMTDLQTKVLMAMVPGPLSIDELAKFLLVSIARATVVVLRLWLDQKVAVPLSTQYLQPSWIVRRLDHGFR